MVGLYPSFLVIALGVWGSTADSSLFDINTDIALPERVCGTDNTAVRKEWFVFLDFPMAN